MMKRRIWKLLCCLLLMLSILPLGALTTSASTTQKEFVFAMSLCPETDATLASAALPASATYTAVLSADTEDLRDLMLYPGGMPFGVKFSTDGVLVVGFCDVDAEGGSVNPAYAAGLRTRDVITSLGGKQIADAAQFGSMIAEAGATPLTLTYTRGGKSYTTTLTPVKSLSENRYKTGLWVRDSGAGIGTVTFIEPTTGAFGGLGHGICDQESGILVSMTRGVVNDVTISGVERGEVGDPGAIKGYFNPGKTGTLLGNTECGVYGIFSGLPAEATSRMPVGKRSEVREGDATILCTLDNGKIGTYTVKITGVDATATGSKCFSITVTDPALLTKTGGIVQGMSGSPVIQNGKLIGAVTHVLISDPTSGYGIFVDNMLRDMPTLLR